MTLRFPVALWQDFSGTFTASVLDGANFAVYDRTAAGAMAQLEKYIAWAMRKEDSPIHESDLADLELRDYRVEIRPEYRIDETAYPIPTTFVFRVTCVDGKRRDGTRHCVAPTLGIRMSYQDGDPIDRLMMESLQQVLGRRTPQELSRELMPPKITLGAVHVKQREVAKKDSAGRFVVLQSVAAPLGKRRRGVKEMRALARDNEVRLLTEHLRGRTNILLLGESGSGKSTVLAEAVRQILRAKPVKKEGEDEDQDDQEQRRQFWRTSGQRLIAGMKYLGQWEERCEAVIGELAETNSVLCVENLLELIRVGGREPGGSVAAFFQAYLERGELQMTAEATAAELDACRRLLPGFADLFQVIRVPEFTATNARTVLDRLLTEGARNLKLELEWDCPF